MIRTLLISTAALALAGSALAAPKAPAAPVVPPAPGAPGAADWRTPDPDNVLVIDTTKGRILVEMTPQVAPNHVTRVKELTRSGLYDGRSFFRVIDAFMAQTGDPQDTGEGGSDKPDLDAEFTFRRGPETPFVQVADQTVAEIGFVGSLPVMTQSSMLMPLTRDGKISGWGLYCPGVAGMARGEAEASANSQFFLMRQAYPSLEKRYTAFGRVISGLDAVRAIKVGEPVTDPDKMLKVRVMADIPAAERPKVRVIDPASAWFKAEIANVRGQMGADFTACAIRIPSEVK
ncbi:MAG: peptidylprolyl isomerase [Phenylobacterium sp.]|nr:peptidylprolyl isomerase [Phenylobacterium sp.]MBP8247112.1 peptidylprolyl isomerase [Phenylobacterium sp.]